MASRFRDIAAGPALVLRILLAHGNNELNCSTIFACNPSQKFSRMAFGSCGLRKQLV